MADSWDNHYTHRARMEFKNVDPALKRILHALMKIQLKEDPDLKQIMGKAGERTVLRLKVKLLEVEL